MSSYDLDYVEIAGSRTPGVAVISDGKIPLKWDERQGYGLSGSTPIFRGVGLVSFNVILTMWTDEHLSEWEAFRKIVDAPPIGRYPKALKVSHPILADMGVTAAIVDSRTQLKKTESNGWQVAISMKQYRKPKLQLAKPDGAKDKKPVDPWDQKIADLTNQLNELSK